MKFNEFKLASLVSNFEKASDEMVAFIVNDCDFIINDKTLEDLKRMSVGFKEVIDAIESKKKIDKIKEICRIFEED